MPYINEHSARIEDPKKYDEFRRENDKFKKGIHAIWGIILKPKRKSELQAIRFDAKEWTVEEAKKWLKDNNIKYISFEPAKEKKADEKKEINEILLYRKINLDLNKTKKDELGRIPLVLSTEYPVQRWDYQEILDHSSGSIDFSRAKDGLPCLFCHNMEIILGRIEDIYIENKELRGFYRAGNSEKAKEILKDIEDKIITDVSIGYTIHDIGVDEDNKIKRFMDWTPYEVSILPIGADINARLYREFNSNDVKKIEEKGFSIFESGKDSEAELLQSRSNDTKKIKEKIMPEENVDIKILTSEVKEDIRKKEMERIEEIYSLGEKMKMTAEAQDHIKRGISVDDFRKVVIEKHFHAVPVQIPTALLGMGEKEKKRYSIVRAIKLLSEGKPLDGMEKEASDAVSKICRREARGFFLPQDILQERQLNVGVSTEGGYLVGSKVLGEEIIELLRNKPYVAQLGARTISGIVGHLLLPRVTGGATAYWLSETGTVTASKQAFGQLALVPHRLVGDTAYTKELLNQASIDVENFVRDDIMSVLAIAKDKAAINGLGAAGEPLGITNTTGIKTITFGAAATWAKVVDFETQLADSNAEYGSMAYLTTPTVRGKWKTTVKATNQAIFIWENDVEKKGGIGIVNGYGAYATKQVSDDKVIFGNWADLILADWAGVDIVVDPYSLKKQGQIEITITLMSDIGVRHAVSFCVSTDSGAQ